MGSRRTTAAMLMVLLSGVGISAWWAATAGDDALVTRPRLAVPERVRLQPPVKLTPVVLKLAPTQSLGEAAAPEASASVQSPAPDQQQAIADLVRMDTMQVHWQEAPEDTAWTEQASAWWGEQIVAHSLATERYEVSCRGSLCRIELHFTDEKAAKQAWRLPDKPRVQGLRRVEATYDGAMVLIYEARPGVRLEELAAALLAQGYR